MNRSKGFTLIELLVVIGIIALLVAILFPVFGTVRDKARQATCASNEKQMGLALVQYTQDYDEYYPLVYYSSTASHWIPNIGGNSVSQNYMDTALYPYVKNAQIYVCPSQPPFANFTGGIWISSVGSFIDLPTTYAVNQMILQRVDMTAPVPVGLSSLGSPATTYAIVEGNTNMSAAGSLIVSSCYTPQWSVPPTTNDIHEGAPHAGGMNVAFCDGHVKWANASFYENATTAYSSWCPSYS